MQDNDNSVFRYVDIKTVLEMQICMLEIFSEIEMISNFTNKIARLPKVILRIRIFIFLILGTLNPPPNVSVTAKDSRSEVIFNQQNKTKGSGM